MGERRGRRGEERRGGDQGGDERRTRGERAREMMRLDSRGRRRSRRRSIAATLDLTRPASTRAGGRPEGQQRERDGFSFLLGMMMMRVFTPRTIGGILSSRSTRTTFFRGLARAVESILND
jgi:hypothetical protein